MTTRKYKELVEQRTKQTLQEWSQQPEIAERDIYRFLHNLKGTAGTVGLSEIEELAGSTLPYFSDESPKKWTVEEWGYYLFPLVELFDEEALLEMVVAEHRNPSGSALAAPPKNEILLVDDDVELVAYLKESLEKQDYYVSIALTAERGLKIFYERKPDLILLDIMLPDKSGIEVLDQIIGKAKKERIPIIIISGEHSKAVQLKAYSLGVMDFLTKPVDIDLFLVLIRNRFNLKREWQESIIIDELTGSFNRKHFNQTMKQLLADYHRTGRTFSLALMDLDHFKRVNDTYGHLVGDEVLQLLAETVRETIRAEDTFCRYGGEEFVLFLPNTDAASAQVVMQRILELFSDRECFARQEAFHVTFSGGITEVNECNDNADKLIEEADLALYASKYAGRNQITVYSDHLPENPSDTVLNVIIVDDDALIRRIVTSHFMSWVPSNRSAVRIQSYVSGVEFLQSDWYASDEKYIILLDGVMPEMDGVEVLEQIRRNYPDINVLVIMLTGRNRQGDIIHALQLGADDYVIKPFHMPELLLRIERLAHRFLS